MNRRLLVVAIVVAAIAVLAVSSGSAASVREGYAVVGLADAEQLFPASAADTKAYDELMDPEFGCGGRGHIEYNLADD